MGPCLQETFLGVLETNTWWVILQGREIYILLHRNIDFTEVELLKVLFMKKQTEAKILVKLSQMFLITKDKNCFFQRKKGFKGGGGSQLLAWISDRCKLCVYIFTGMQAAILCTLTWE